MLVVFWVDLKLIGLSLNFAPAIYPAELRCQLLRRPILASCMTGSMPMTTIAKAAMAASS